MVAPRKALSHLCIVASSSTVKKMNYADPGKAGYLLSDAAHLIGILPSGAANILKKAEKNADE
jgi:hypothetical protein